MRVVATQLGFFNGTRVRAGTEFEVPEGTKGSWFAPVEAVVAQKAVKAAKAARETKDVPTALSQVGKGKSQTFNEAMAKKDDGGADLT
jgi:hypothetical protein